MCQASVSLRSINAYLGTMTTWPLECPRWGVSISGHVQHSPQNWMLPIGGEKGSLAATWQLYRWKDRYCLKGMVQPMGGEGSKQWATERGQVARVSKDLQMFPGSLTESKGDAAGLH